MAARNKSNELHLTRLFDAKLPLVWDAWTDPEQVAVWWGPRGFSLTTHAKDLRPGGHWRYTMHSPDGTDYPNVTHYCEVEKYAKLVYDHGATDNTPPLFRVTVLFTAVGEKTKMDLTMRCETAEAAENISVMIKKAGGGTTWDRLAEYVEKKTAGVDNFVINHSFDAPIETLFAMWEDREHLARWLPPAGAEMRFLRAEIRVGGSSFYVMNGAYGTMYGRCQYRVIDRPHRMIYSQQFCDENEALSHHPLSPTWPKSMLTTVDFVAESSERTRVTVRLQPEGEVSATELATFIAAKAGMSIGWTGSFDKLEPLLTTSSTRPPSESDIPAK